LARLVPRVGRVARRALPVRSAQLVLPVLRARVRLALRVFRVFRAFVVRLVRLAQELRALRVLRVLRARPGPLALPGLPVLA